MPDQIELTRRQLALFLGEDYGTPEYPCRVSVGDDERLVEVLYRGVRLIRQDAHENGDDSAWWPRRIDLPEAGEGMPTTLMSEDFLPIVDVLSVVETIRQIDMAADWFTEDARGPAVDAFVRGFTQATQPPWPTPQGDEDEARERRRLNDPATNPEWPVGAFIDQYEVDRHAEKQHVSYNDAWRYFESQGYDMSEVLPQS